MVTLDHTIVAAGDKTESAIFLTQLLGLPSPAPFGHFLVVSTGDVSLDYAEVGPEAPMAPQHYAFLVSEDEFGS